MLTLSLSGTSIICTQTFLMKKSLRLTIFFYFIFCSEFYAQQHSGIVTGKVIEESTKLAAEFVNVALVNSNDSTIRDGAVTNRKGDFIIDSIAEGNYFLRIKLFFSDAFHFFI